MVANLTNSSLVEDYAKAIPFHPTSLSFTWSILHGSCLRKSYLEIGKGVKTARNSLPFSHLFFANDLILFAKAAKKKKKKKMLHHQKSCRYLL